MWLQNLMNDLQLFLIYITIPKNFLFVYLKIKFTHLVYYCTEHTYLVWNFLYKEEKLC